jgi:hypothetical protein
MKNILIIILFIPFLLSGCLRSLEKDGIANETIFKGRVVDKHSKPLSGIMVRITNGNLIYNSVTTDKDGMFQIVVDITKIDNSYFIQVGEEGTLVKRSSLKGFGQDVYDYGDIPFVNINLPEVETLKLVDMTPNSFTCKCNVKSQGGAIIKERGVCWSTNIPSVSDNKEPFGSGTGIFSCTISDQSININTTTYYARAYAINEYGVGYGDALEISSSKLAYFSLPSMEFGGYVYRIYQDLGAMQWQQAKTACENLVAYGFEDWFFPNKEEMMAIATETNILDKKYIYWTSTASFTDGACYYLEFVDDIWKTIGGDYYHGKNMPYNTYHVIPVRKDR